MRAERNQRRAERQPKKLLQQQRVERRQSVGKISNLIHKILHADIIKVFSLTSVATLVKMATGLVSVKVVAGIIGPAGVALVGQLNNFSTIAMQLACGGINSGVTKYVSESKEDKAGLRGLLSTALRLADGRGLLQDMQLAARLPDAGEGKDGALRHDGDRLLAPLPDAGIPAGQGQRSCRPEPGVPDQLYSLYSGHGDSI